MVLEVWKSKARCIGAISITQWCHGGIGVDRNSTGPEKAERAREKAACWHYKHNPTRRVARCIVDMRKEKEINIDI